MWMYIGLILVILLASGFFGTLYKGNHEKREKAILLFGIILIFLLLALKKDTIGIDIAGYEEAYEESALHTWLDTDWIYFESGYTILMQFLVFRGVSFQAFTALLYLVLCSALYLFIRTYSKNVTLSLLIFICYQFLVFSISGLRQTLATAICLFAFLCLKKVNIRRLIVAVLLTLLATTIHQSSLVFFAILFLRIWKTGKVHLFNWICICLAALASRNFIWNFISAYLKEVDTTLSVTLGGNFVFLIGIALFCWATTNCRVRIGGRQINTPEALEQKDGTLTFFQQSVFLCIALTLLFSGNSLQRAVMYSSVFLIPGLTQFISLYEEDYQKLLNVAMGLFLIALFAMDSLIPNQLSICPYLFFWQ